MLEAITTLIARIHRDGLVTLLDYVDSCSRETCLRMVTVLNNPKQEYRLLDTPVCDPTTQQIRYTVCRLHRGQVFVQRDAQGWRMSPLPDDVGDRLAGLPDNIHTVGELAHAIARQPLAYRVWLGERAAPVSLYAGFATSPERLSAVEVAATVEPSTAQERGLISFIGCEQPLPIVMKQTPTLQFERISGLPALRFFRHWR